MGQLCQLRLINAIVRDNRRESGGKPHGNSEKLIRFTGGGAGRID